ncbi:MAG: hypothetical protein K0A90_00070 [Methanosarcinaceae archaeon]|nr:hypothetical protein [Methanosarcinaceae archaeon]
MGNEINDKKINVFAKNTEKVEDRVEPVQEAPVTSGRQVIDESTMETVNWINLPKKADIGESTPELKIGVGGYYTQEGKTFVNKTNGKSFYSGLTNKNKEEIGEYLVEGESEQVMSRIRISNWELVYKMNALVRYCRDNNFTLANQTVKFKRVAGGADTAGHNWVLEVPSLKIKIVGDDNSVAGL